MSIQTRIKQRVGTLADWNQNDIVLLSGELAVVQCDNQTRFKVGNGTSSFTQLPFIDQNLLCTQHVVANSIAQGIHADSVPYGLAAGAYISAGANFSQALGFDAKTLSSDLYSFVWNGDDSRAIGSYYQSHGKGTFSINPLSGINGVYIGEQTLSSILQTYLANKVKYSSELTAGEVIGTLSIDGIASQLYAPESKPSRYALIDAELLPAGGSISCAVQDQTITTIGISSSTTPVIVQLPAPPEDGARDFILRIEISSATAPEFTFAGVGESIDFDSEDDSWAVLEPGLNLVSFTETKRGGQAQ